jgi:hypothetical protein
MRPHPHPQPDSRGRLDLSAIDEAGFVLPRCIKHINADAPWLSSKNTSFGGHFVKKGRNATKLSRENAALCKLPNQAGNPAKSLFPYAVLMHESGV